MTAAFLPGLLLQPIDCSDVSDRWENEGACEDEAAVHDADGDGNYEGCPEW